MESVLCGYTLRIAEETDCYRGTVLNPKDEAIFVSQRFPSHEEVEEWGRLTIYKIFVSRNIFPTLLFDSKTNQIIYRNSISKQYNSETIHLLIGKILTSPSTETYRSETLVNGLSLVSFKDSALPALTMKF